MKRRQKLILLAGVALTAGAWLLFAHTAEPRYEGKPVSYWFRKCLSSNSDESDAGSAALLAMGTNAVPFLVREALDTNVDSGLRKKLVELSDDHRDWPIPRFVSRERRQMEALGALSQIDIPPDLLLGELRDALTGTNAEQQLSAIAILVDAKQESPEFIPSFEKALSYPDRRARVIAAIALGRFREKAVRAIPDLNSAFRRETDLDVQTQICLALCKIDTQQTNALAFLTNLLAGSAGTDRAAGVARKLGTIGTNAIATAALMEVLRGTNSALWQDATISLTNCEVPLKECLPLLTNHLGSGAERERFHAADLILRFDPSNYAAMMELVHLTGETNQYQDKAIDRLVLCGMNAAAVGNNLKQLEGMSNRVIASKIKVVLRPLGMEDAVEKGK